MKNFRLAAILIFVLSASCSHGRQASPVRSGEDPKEVVALSGPRFTHALTREVAIQRRRLLSNVAYALWFGLDESHEDYQGRAVIRFEVRSRGRELSQPLALDFVGGTLHSLTINGVHIDPLMGDPTRYDGHRIWLKPKELLSGLNRVEISFSHLYSRDGNGLHRFKDPVDNNVYLYSNFEPFLAHRMFPCFDQPDLKASFELTVEAPEEWEVISATQERDVTKVDGRKSWQFPPSPLFSTYVFSVHAGPYAVWKADAEGIPLRLFARQSLRSYVDSKEWFEITRQGLGFYSENFGYPYPYSKYDQVLVPEFNEGAMENVAAVTLSEDFVFRSRVTEDRKEERANTILHEMAHQWFGDLVTLRWWNGLWLNESFATFMASRALVEATKYKSAWQTFFADMKQWAYWEDQLTTTHPIEVSVPDTAHARSNFDGVTYGKGAATLKQLRFFLGDESFTEGVQRYFSRFALRNTTLTDFIKVLTEASERDLSAWQKSWFQTSGVNTLRADWACEGGKISRFALRQGLAEAGTELRSHRTKIGLYSFTQKGKKSLRSTDIIEVSYSSADTGVAEALGKLCPAFVFPNHDDQDYAKVELDPVSLETAKKDLAKIEDPLLRQMTWHTLWQMVVDGQLKSQNYLDTVLTQSDSESNINILQKIWTTVADPRAGRATALKYLAPQFLRETQGRVEGFLRKKLLSSPEGSDLQLVWYHALRRAASDAQTVDFLRKVYFGKQKLPGLKIDQDRRWELVEVLARTGAPDALQLIATERKLDPTDLGSRAAIRAEASIPSLENKTVWLARIMGDAPGPLLPISKLKEAMNSFHREGYEDLTRPFVDPYFNRLPQLALGSKGPFTTDEEYWDEMPGALYPSLCDAQIAQKTGELLKQNPGLPAAVVRSLRISKQEVERCVRARAKSLD